MLATDDTVNSVMTDVGWPDPDTIPDTPDDPMWTRCGDPWPDWVTGFRPWQVQAVRELVDGYRRGARLMVLDAPTGAGKTLIGEMVARLGPGPTTYVSSTISLQQQFVADFPYARKIMGAANYETEQGPPWVTCADCDGPACGWCANVDDCPYTVAKARAMGARVAVANTSYWLHQANHVPIGRGLRGRPGLIIDECDTFESALMGFVEVYIGSKWTDRVRMEPLVKGARAATVQTWFEEFAQRMTDWVKKNRKASDVRGKRDVKDAARMAEKARWFAREWAARGGDEGEGSHWVRDYPKDGWSPVVFRAVKVDRMGARHAWNWVGEEGLGGEYADGAGGGGGGGAGGGGGGVPWVLAMSATVVSADEWTDSCGVNAAGIEWGKVTVDSPFPAENRPVIALPVADMKMSTWEKDIATLVQVVDRILERHADDKVLVHTVSWKLTDHIAREVKRSMKARGDTRPVVTHERADGAKGRDRALERHKNARGGPGGGSVLISPSMDRGVDLPGDDCRVQIVCKIPFPYLGNRQIAERTRLPGGQSWYLTQTARTLVQMTGRGVRSADDHAVTYVLDRQFGRWYGEAKRMLPAWWVEAVKIGKIREWL